jgi:hypothetical protein
LTVSRNLVTFVYGPLGGVATGRGRAVELAFGPADSDNDGDETVDAFAGHSWGLTSWNSSAPTLVSSNSRRSQWAWV